MLLCIYSVVLRSTCMPIKKLQISREYFKIFFFLLSINACVMVMRVMCMYASLPINFQKQLFQLRNEFNPYTLCCMACAKQQRVIKHNNFSVRFSTPPSNVCKWVYVCAHSAKLTLPTKKNGFECFSPLDSLSLFFAMAECILILLQHEHINVIPFLVQCSFKLYPHSNVYSDKISILFCAAIRMYIIITQYRLSRD